ncbi:MAG: hypothetical protein Q7R34_10205, partial [Dehalococcoidia bacterium]|nr:hypothetical protein [Dehalococcoidia bacterium]
MKKALLFFILLVTLLSLVTYACSPKTPIPTVAPQPVTPRATVSSPAQTSQDSWDQIVAAAKKEGTITPYSFIFTGNFATVVARSFEQRYGIKFSPVIGTGTLIMERIRSEQVAGKYIADTFDSAASLVATAKIDGLTVNIGPLPELDNKDKWRADPRLDPEGHFVGTYVITTTIYVNTNLVKPGE